MSTQSTSNKTGHRSAATPSLKLGARRTQPKHGKAQENRLYTKIRRGGAEQKGRDHGINPDSSIRVAAVCGNWLRFYSKGGRIRRLEAQTRMAHYGAALLAAQEFDQFEREYRARNPG